MSSTTPDVTSVLVDAETLREKIHAKATAALQEAFKLNIGGRTLSVEDIEVSRREFSPEEQKRALLRGDSLRTPVKGTLVLKDAEGKVLDKSVKHTLVHLPYLTERHTVIADGNEYQFANQLRRKPGVYTQRSENGELKTVFNLGRGANFDLGFNAEKGTFAVQYGTTNVPLYAMLRGLGVPHDAIAAALGPGLASANEAAQGRQVDSAIDKLYEKLVPPTMRAPGLSRDQKVEMIKKRYAVTTLDPEVTRHTLGYGHSTVTPHALLDAAKRLVGVHKGVQTVDDTDSLAFKTFHAVDDFLAERIRLGAREWAPKARRALNGRTDVKASIRPAPLTPSIHKFITTSSLTAVPSGINPMELIDHAVKVTALGEGGIPSDRAIPYDARMTHNTHFGAIDPVRTPECFVGTTEVLTKAGWKKWSEVTATDVFACRIEGRLEFHKASRLIKEKYTGVMYGVRSPKLEYLVTPNHKVLCAPIDRVYPLDNSAAQKLNLVRADDTHGKPRVFDTAHDAYAGHDEPYQIPQLPDYENNVGAIEMPVWASFMGWYLSEGNISRQANGEAARVVISQVRSVNRVKCEMIESVLRRLPFKWSANSKLFMICHRQLAAYLEQFGFCDTKFIPDYFFSASVESRENLLEALMLGDGRGTSKRATGKTYRQQVYTTTSRQLALDVERIAISLGRSVRVSKYEDRREERYLDVYEVRLLCDRFRQAVPRKNHYYTAKHDDYVYCATVPGGLLYVRHGQGLGHWSGNSGHSGVDVRASLLAHRDDKGNLYTVVHDVKTGKEAYLKAGDLNKHVVAFANQPLKGRVMAFVNGEVQPVDASRVTHQMHHVSHQFSPATALIPMIHNIQGNRAIMGSKMGTQALPLLAREAPHVQVQSSSGKGVSYETVFGHMVVPASPVKGTVEKIENGYVYIRPHGSTKKAEALDLAALYNNAVRAAEDPDAEAFEKEAASDAGLVKVPYQQHFPFPSKTFLHHTLDVKPGDKVEAGQRLGDSNFTRDGTLALGKNLSVAYIPYHGLNSNDAVVISQSASKKLTSEHMYREVYALNSRITLNKAKHRAHYGTKYTASQYNKLDEAGVIKVGAKVDPKDPLVVGLVKTELQGTDLMLGRISKSLVKPYKEVVLSWDHGTPGVVSDVVRTATQIAILVKTEEQMQIGDKLAARFGNKGVVAHIVPDHEMLHDEAGKPIDLLLSSAGVISRINPAQVIETAIGKVAEKTGKPIVYDNAAQHDALKWAQDLMAKHGVKDKETIYDPITKRQIKGPDGQGVLVGRQYFYKLFKSTDTNFAGHGVGPYDGNEQPLKTGGDDSAKGIGKMELDALIAHNARNILHENATIKSQKNDEFWRAIQLGTPLPTPKPSFAFNKFRAMLEGAGVKVDKRDSKFKLLPLTDRDVLNKSKGEIENKKTLTAKGLRPEKGGLFDVQATGGPQGTLYSHISLHEPIPNPVFEEPVRRLLGLTQKQFDQHVREKGGAWFKSELSKINIDQKLQSLNDAMKKASGPELDNVVKQIKYLKALKAENLKPHEAYVISKIPVIPPQFRPVLPDLRNPSEVSIGDANKLYGHLMDANHVLKSTALPSDLPKHRELMFNAVGAVFGTHVAQDEKLQKQEVKGFLSNIAGVGTPKGGFFQRKLMRRTMDVSGRGTAVPDPNLGMDEVGIPEQMLWQMLDKLIVARLVRQGYSALDARAQVDKKTKVAKDALIAETRERPVLINRAPTLHRWSIIAAYPRLVSGKTIRVSPFIEKGMNLDFDGDTLQVHAPVQPGAIADAKKMTLSSLLMSDQQRDKILAFPQHEAVIGVALASEAKGNNGPVKKFNTREDALRAWRSGQLQLSDQIEVLSEKRAELEEEPSPNPEYAGLSTEEALSFWPAENVTGYGATIDPDEYH